MEQIKFGFAGQMWILKGENLKEIVFKERRKEIRKVLKRECSSCRYKEEIVDDDCKQRNCPQCKLGLLQVEY